MKPKSVAEGRAFQGVWIPAWLYLEPDMSWTKKILWLEIASLDKPPERCYKGNAGFASFLGITERQVSKLISELFEEGRIEVVGLGKARRIHSNLNELSDGNQEQKFQRTRNKSSDEHRTKRDSLLIPGITDPGITLQGMRPAPAVAPIPKDVFDLLFPIHQEAFGTKAVFGDEAGKEAKSAQSLLKRAPLDEIGRRALNLAKLSKTAKPGSFQNCGIIPSKLLYHWNDPAVSAQPKATTPRRTHAPRQQVDLTQERIMELTADIPL